TSATMSTADSTASTRSPLTTSAGSDDSGRLRGLRVLETRRTSPKAVEDEIDTDGDERNCDDRHDHRPRLDGQRDAILADHEPPVRGRRPQAQTEEAQGRDYQYRCRRPEPVVDEQRPPDVGEDLAPRDPDGA